MVHVIFVLLLLSTFSQCCELENQGPPIQCDNCICPAIYKPLCAKKGDDYKTYSNDCAFNCRCDKGWSKVGDGECQSCLPSTPPCEKCGCPKIYQPICARNGNNYWTFANKCIFDCRCNCDYLPIGDGECIVCPGPEVKPLALP